MMPGPEVPECNKTLNRYFLVNSSEEWLWLLTSWNSCHATKVSTVPLGDHHKQSQKGFTFYNDIKNSWGCSKCFTFAKDLLITFFFGEENIRNQWQIVETQCSLLWVQPHVHFFNVNHQRVRSTLTIELTAINPQIFWFVRVPSTVLGRIQAIGDVYIYFKF